MPCPPDPNVLDPPPRRFPINTFRLPSSVLSSLSCRSLASRTLSIDRRRSRLGPTPAGYAERHAGPLRAATQVPVRVIFDRSVIEVFALDGETVMTERVWPTQPLTHVEWIGDRRPASGSTRLMSLRPLPPRR